MWTSSVKTTIGDNKSIIHSIGCGPKSQRVVEWMSNGDREQERFNPKFPSSGTPRKTMNLLGNNHDNNAVLSVVAAAAVVTASAAVGSQANSNNLSTNSSPISHKSTRASNCGVKGSGFNQVQIQSSSNGLNNNSNNCANFQTMDFGGLTRDSLGTNMVHHQQQQQNQQHHHNQSQHHLQSVDVSEIADLRPNSLNNILKNNIISSGNHSPGLLMVDINNNSNDLNLNDTGDGLTSSSSGCNDNVSARDFRHLLSTTNYSDDRHPLHSLLLRLQKLATINWPLKSAINDWWI